MIESIEAWDWESHEHTLIEGISPGLNLFRGDSNSGKTSIVRILKLVAYNDFDTKCIRTGATKCVVLVKTERGSVKVTRGPKHNLWEVTKIGQATQYFDKIGVNVCPEAAEILGLNVITLGDVKIPVNIMDQLESHFMLSSIGGKDASGSMRAQIVDEISGLSGIEALIKDVSLDHHRFGREINETEKKMEEIRSQLHSEVDLQKEEVVLGKAEKELTDHTTIVALANEGETLTAKAVSISQGVETIKRALKSIPDTDLAINEIARAEIKTSKAGPAEVIRREAQVSSGKLEVIRDRLSGMPNEQDAFTYLDEADEDVRIEEIASEFLDGCIKTQDSLKKKHDRLSEMPDEQKALDIMDLAIEDVSTVETAEAFLETCIKTRLTLKNRQNRLDEIGKDSADQDIKQATILLDCKVKIDELLMAAQRVRGLIDKLDRMVATNGIELALAERERDELLASIKTCPLTLKPVSKECVA